MLGEETGVPGENPRRWRGTANPAHVLPRSGVEPGSHWWEASVLATSPPRRPITNFASRCPKMACACPFLFITLKLHCPTFFQNYGILQFTTQKQTSLPTCVDLRVRVTDQGNSFHAKSSSCYFITYKYCPQCLRSASQPISICREQHLQSFHWTRPFFSWMFVFWQDRSNCPTTIRQAASWNSQLTSSVTLYNFQKSGGGGAEAPPSPSLSAGPEITTLRALLKQAIFTRSHYKDILKNVQNVWRILLKIYWVIL